MGASGRRSARSAVALFAVCAAALVTLERHFQHVADSRREAIAELHERRQRIRLLEVVAAKLDRFKVEAELLDARVERARRLVPPAADAAELRADLRDVARGAGVRMGPVIMGPFRVRELDSEIPLSIEVRGSSATVARFAEALCSAPRLLAVRQVEVEPRGAGLWARFDVRAFYAQPQEAVP